MEPENALERLGGAVRTQRNRLGLSQEKLAERAGLHRNYISGVERGERNIGFVNLVKLAAALDLSLSGLAGQIERDGDAP